MSLTARVLFVNLGLLQKRTIFLLFAKVKAKMLSSTVLEKSGTRHASPDLDHASWPFFHGPAVGLTPGGRPPARGPGLLGEPRLLACGGVQRAGRLIQHSTAEGRAFPDIQSWCSCLPAVIHTACAQKQAEGKMQQRRHARSGNVENAEPHTPERQAGKLQVAVEAIVVF